MNNASDELPPDGSSEEQDALRDIADIGPRYAEALHQIGVHNPADLASYTPESLALELREKAGVRVTPDRIRLKDWIGQAQRLVENQHAVGDEIGESETLPEALEVGTEAEASAEDISGPDDAEWRERDMFTIRFIEGLDSHGKQKWQIRVYHEGGTGREMPFDGLDPNPWVNWIFEQMGLPGQTVHSLADMQPLETEDQLEIEEQPYMETSDALTFSADTQNTDRERVSVAFDEVDVNAWPPAPERFLVVEARFRFQGEFARELAQERTPYLLEFYLINLESQASNPIGSNRGQMEPNREEYELRQNIPMPAPGQYELQTIMLLPNQNTKAFRDGPTFNVVAERPRTR